ncbi:Uncharacterized protein Rs2_03876 [Raphanus sativus]|nr:Uncharacterized protein Rs2_03876 [Raphanus sativus]
MTSSYVAGLSSTVIGSEEDDDKLIGGDDRICVRHLASARLDSSHLTSTRHSSTRHSSTRHSSTSLSSTCLCSPLLKIGSSPPPSPMIRRCAAEDFFWFRVFF